MADTPGALLAHRYRLVEQLGRGGMGVVWRARDEVFGRDVAIKEVLLPPHLTDAERETVVQRTRREARVAARLSHPNVVKVYDVVESDGRPWIVMELVRAKSLTDIVEENGPLPAQRVAAIGLQVLSALTAAHAAGITHRDVKPGNVLCSENGRVVLSDFGIATIADDPSVTVNGVLMGSPAYIAPERVRGGPARAASDLWSLAATLYAAVEGRPPYDRGSAVPTVTAVVNEDPDPLQRAGLLAPVLQQIFVKDPDARPDAATIRTMLREVASTPESSTDGVPAGATIQLGPQTDRDGAERPRTGTSIVRPRPDRDEPAKAAATAIVSAAKVSAKTKAEPKVPSQRRRTPLVVAAFAVAFLLIGGSALQNMVSQAKDRPTSSAEDRTTPSPTPSAAESSQAPSPSNGSPKPSPSAPPVTDSDGDRRRAEPVVTIPRPSASKSASPKPTTKPTPKPTKTTPPPEPTATPTPEPTPTPTPTVDPPDPGGGGGEPPTQTSEPAEPTEPAAPEGDEPAVPAP